LTEDEEPIAYFDVDARPVREDHSIDKLDTPREIQQNLEAEGMDKPGEYLRYQKQKRMQIMQGLHQGIKYIEGLEKKLENGDLE
jgi:hypothetical protein